MEMIMVMMCYNNEKLKRRSFHPERVLGLEYNIIVETKKPVTYRGH